MVNINRHKGGQVDWLFQITQINTLLVHYLAIHIVYQGLFCRQKYHSLLTGYK